MTTLIDGSAIKTSDIERWCIKNTILLLETVQKWHSESPDSTFENLLVRNFENINEDWWMEHAARLPGAPIPFPVSERPLLPATAVGKHAEVLRRELYGIILQDDPVLVVGILNPFLQKEVATFIANYYSGCLFKIVSITPHAFVRLASIAERSAAAGIPPYEGENLQEWCTRLNFDHTGFPDEQALIEELWTGDPCIPVISPRQYDQSQQIDGIPDAILIAKTATHAWVASPNAADQILHDRLYQSLSRKVYLMGVGPREFERILEAQKYIPEGGATKVDKSHPLVVRDWKIPHGSQNVESLLFDKILEAAIRMGASDIHFEPKRELSVVRFRVDGELITQAPIPKTTYSLLMRRAKIIGGMRHETTGIMQDGAGYHEVDGARWDMRYSVCVCKGGEESMVIRIFGSKIPKLEDLNIPIKEMTTLEWFLSQESGMFVMTGPTGSGKTTTLYACLSSLDKPEVKIMTIEHPVEKHFDNALQVDVRDGEEGDRNTITFKAALRTAMRHDPDVIMIGEMRDSESAGIAVQAALTGHLVLSTVHANDAVGVIERMTGSFGIDKIALGYSLKLSVAQRLVAKLCPLCRETHTATPEELRPFPEVQVTHPQISSRKGCSACRGTGVSGRRAIMEMLPIDSEIVALIEQRAGPNEIRRHNEKRGYSNLIKQATLLLLRGEIEIDEARTFLTRPVC